MFTGHPDDLPTEDGLTITTVDPVATARELKAEQSGLDIWLCGGGELAASLIDEIDELRLKVNPLVLGDGIPLIGSTAAKSGAAAMAFTRRMSREFESGVTYVEYVRS